MVGPHVLRLFGERCSVCGRNCWRIRKKPLREPADLRHQVLLQYDGRTAAS
jgi:hypothetical protein